jgi:Astacin (Peptidase family M12A)
MATTVCRATFIWLLIALAPTLFVSLSLAQNASPISSGSGIYRGQRVSFQIVKGKMIFEGDIALERVDQKLPEKNLQPGATLDYLQYRWPRVGSVYQIPYSIDPSSGDVANINAAVSDYNSIFSGIIQWVSHTSETDYVNFKLDPTDTSGAGNSYLGRVGGQQLIWGSGSCTVATLLHEMGHATGFWHEQSRPDRNNYVTVMSSNMINTLQLNSAQQFDNMQSLTLYDWGSLMHYGAWGFTKNGAPTLESIPWDATFEQSWLLGGRHRCH